MCFSHSIHFYLSLAQLPFHELYTKVLTESSKQWMGLGNKNITFQCKREYWQNPTWQLGETFSSDVTSCASETLSFAPPVVPAWGGNGGK